MASPESAPARTEQAVSQRWTHLLGLDLLATTGRLLRSHWWELLAIALVAYVAHYYLMRLAIVIGRSGPVPGLLALAIVPAVPLAATVLMLLVMRRRERGGQGVTGFVVAIGSVLVPFLVIYESRGSLREDVGAYFFDGMEDSRELASAGVTDLGELVDARAAVEASARMPDGTSPLALTVVAIAFVIRMLLSRLIQRDEAWTGALARTRTPLRLLLAYSEVVWLVLGAIVINAGIEAMRGWWDSRRLGVALHDWWAQVTEGLPNLGAFAEAVVAAAGTVLDGAAIGVLIPIAWLSIGVIVYGLQVADTIDDRRVVSAVGAAPIVGILGRRVSPAVITTAWHRIADPDNRFGALIGGLAMVLRAGFAQVLVFCLAFTTVTVAVPYLTWGVLRVLLEDLTYRDWMAFVLPLDAVNQVVVLVLSSALLAAFADALLARFGAASSLRLPSPPAMPEEAADPAERTDG